MQVTYELSKGIALSKFGMLINLGSSSDSQTFFFQFFNTQSWVTNHDVCLNLIQ